jgi:hypothetical protein
MISPVRYYRITCDGDFCNAAFDGQGGENALQTVNRAKAGDWSIVEPTRTLMNLIMDVPIRYYCPDCKELDFPNTG